MILKDMLTPSTGIMDGVTLFEDPTSCCEKLIKTNGGKCEVVEDGVCLPSTASPTRRPTNAPTSNPTKGSSNSNGNGECSSKWHPDEGKNLLYDFMGLTFYQLLTLLISTCPS